MMRIVVSRLLLLNWWRPCGYAHLIQEALLILTTPPMLQNAPRTRQVSKIAKSPLEAFKRCPRGFPEAFGSRLGGLGLCKCSQKLPHMGPGTDGSAEHDGDPAFQFRQRKLQS